MLNLKESILDFPSYLKQRDLPIKGVVYIAGALVFIASLRGQISEVKLLQLVPSFYFLLLLLAFLFLVSISTLLLRVIFQIDRNKKWGTKTETKIDLLIIAKFLFFIYSAGMFIILNTLIPISLDFFNATGQKTLEDTWALGEVLGLEIFLLFVVILLFLIPVLVIFGLYCEQKVKSVPQDFRIIIFAVLIFSGVITPTVDGYTQVTLALATLVLYIITLTVFLKRLIMKSQNLVSVF